MRVMVGMPIYGNQVYATTARQIMELYKFLQQKDVYMDWAALTSTYVETGRNIIADHFLNSDFTHLLFIDSDIEFTPAQAWALLQADLDVVAGIYPIKDFYWEGLAFCAKNMPWQMLGHVHAKSLFYRIDKKKRDSDLPDPNRPAEVTGAATGFMCIKREVMLAYREAYPERRIPDKNRMITEFFALDWVEINGQRDYCGDDIFFCHMLRKMGRKIYVLPKITPGHIGQHTFRGCVWCSRGHRIHEFVEQKNHGD